MVKGKNKIIVSLILAGIFIFFGNTINAEAQELVEAGAQQEIVLPQNIGDSAVIFDNRTEKWSVKLISEQESKTRATNRVSEKVYVFEHEVLPHIIYNRYYGGWGAL